MNLKETIRKVLNEGLKEVINESEDLSHIEYLVNKNYLVDFEARSHSIHLAVKIVLIPKPGKEVPKDIVYYSSYERKYTPDGNVIYKKYDENTAYNEASFFQMMNLKDDLEKWLRKKSNEFIRKNYDE